MPEEFTAARNARAKEAKAAGDAESRRRCRPSASRPPGRGCSTSSCAGTADEVQQVLDLGAQLRAAQGNLGAAEVRALDQQRRQLTRAVAQQARTLGQDAGRRVTDQVTTDVEETLRSAMVDEAAGAALLTGLLTDTFSSTGLEPVDLSRVVAVPGSAAGAATAQPVPTASEHVEEPDPDHERRVARPRRRWPPRRPTSRRRARPPTRPARLAARPARSARRSRPSATRPGAGCARSEAARDGRRAGGRRDPRPREGGRPPGVGDRGRRAVAAPARPAARAAVTGRVTSGRPRVAVDLQIRGLGGQPHSLPGSARARRRPPG